MGYYPMRLDPNVEEDKMIIDRLDSSVPGQSKESMESDNTDVWTHSSFLIRKGVSGVGIDEEFMFSWCICDGINNCMIAMPYILYASIRYEQT